jgi:hypothetical protein
VQVTLAGVKGGDKTLHAKIGQLALENDFLEGALTKAGLLSVPDDRELLPCLLFGNASCSAWRVRQRTIN